MNREEEKDEYDKLSAEEWLRMFGKTMKINNFALSKKESDASDRSSIHSDR